jgi:hypothetical protein
VRETKLKHLRQDGDDVGDDVARFAVTNILTIDPPYCRKFDDEVDGLMEKIGDYITVSGTTQELDAEVKKRLGQGWELYGSPYGMSLNGTHLACQAMIKREDPLVPGGSLTAEARLPVEERALKA